MEGLSWLDDDGPRSPAIWGGIAGRCTDAVVLLRVPLEEVGN